MVAVDVEYVCIYGLELRRVYEETQSSGKMLC